MSRGVQIKLIIITLIFIGGLFLFWQTGFIELPSRLVYYEQLMHAKLSLMPEATIEVDVPFHRQEHSLSCEVAALKMAMAGHGVDVSESELIELLEFDRTPKTGDIWGDPDRGFVGSIDGKMFGDGYGVYAGPIARLGLRWLRTESFRQGTAQQLAWHLFDGNPVIIWGFVGRGRADSWQTPYGKIVNAIDGEHTKVVYGFTGIPSNPTGFFVVDPVFGKSYWDLNSFMENWEPLGYMGAVVYPNPHWVKVAGDTKVWEISKDGFTRHWVNMSWDEFEKQGGFAEAIKIVSPEELDKFKQGGDASEI